MPRDIFHDREQAEETAYFQAQDQKLIEKLRQQARLSEIAAALAEKLQVDDPQLLQRIMQLGITLQTGAAFILAPLVEVAWADGNISPQEHQAVVQLAAARGVAPDSPDMQQLLAWLAQRPSDALFDAALDAIRIGISVLPEAEREQRIDTMIHACEQVAQASGGLAMLLHLHGGVSDRERSVLREIKARLERR